MTLDEFATEVIKIYRQHGMDVDGFYNDRGCIEPCCYPNAAREAAGIAAIEALMEREFPEVSVYMYVGDYGSVQTLVNRIKRQQCEHLWELKGVSSMTSTGLKDSYTCIKCNMHKYVSSGEVV